MRVCLFLLVYWGGKEDSLAILIDEYRQSLKSRGITKKHVRDTIKRILRVVEDMNWSSLKSITPRSFELWRNEKALHAQTSEPLTPKSSNEYLTSLKAFLNWLKKARVVDANPLEFVEKSQTRGFEKKKRRSWSADEILTFLQSDAYYGIAIFIAVTTGLRRAEIESLVWEDLHLEAEEPFILTRASTTKDKKSEAIPIVPELEEALRSYMPEEFSPTDPVLGFKIPRVERIRKDLKALVIV